MANIDIEAQIKNNRITEILNYDLQHNLFPMVDNHEIDGNADFENDEMFIKVYIPYSAIESIPCKISMQMENSKSGVEVITHLDVEETDSHRGFEANYQDEISENAFKSKQLYDDFKKIIIKILEDVNKYVINNLDED
jgi:hypothetical protein